MKPLVHPTIIRFGSTELTPIETLLDQLSDKHSEMPRPMGQRRTLVQDSAAGQFIPPPKSYLICTDLGGDQGVFRILAEAAKTAGTPFRPKFLGTAHDGVVGRRSEASSSGLQEDAGLCDSTNIAVTDDQQFGGKRVVVDLWPTTETLETALRRGTKH